MGKNNTSVLGMIVVFIMIGSFTFTGTNATIIPIINAKIDTGKFYPQPINSINPLGLNDYYIIPTGGNLASQIFYYSNMTGGSNSANYIGGSSTNGETYGATGTTLITDGALLPGSLRTNTTRNGFNPFLPVNDSLPRIVKLNNQNGQHFQTTQVEPFSLHMDYSLTFFC